MDQEFALTAGQPRWCNRQLSTSIPFKPPNNKSSKGEGWMRGRSPA
jgi:hypothetical protein